MARLASMVSNFLTMTDKQHVTIGEKILDFGNIGADGLIFGSALASGGIKWFHLVSGVWLWFLMFCGYLLLTKPRG